ncbi:hypothetical protein HETIRDRAFT_115597 [Heterobasidion irregulare TC 32-1]|uniref:Uncharacterized protein n=1 Tax=Heterobasidion irregulare (strain TC 32-1) TaxID=747525 RepID=W4KA02_HETIT|nr:uncharacterized protein HETIRDRAFT_115597 [Heterobasidion irregulare TC 32-1]ETW82175.1 hypothetical protein HETIRDRAFT_115597 [Heterobasidion irregulare TC 32-1]
MCNPYGIFNDPKESTQLSLAEVCQTIGVDLNNIGSGIMKECTPQLEFISNFKRHWSSSEPRSLGIPLEWKLKRPPNPWHMQELTSSSALMTLMRPIENLLKYLIEDELIQRHDNFDSFAPDFLLRAPRTAVLRSGSDNPLSINSYYSLHFFLETVAYPGDEDTATFVVSSFFLSTPGCTLMPKLESDFPPILSGANARPVEAFGLLMDPMFPFSINSKAARASIIQPALLIGMKGPSQWPTLPSVISPSTPQVSLDQKLHDLSQLIQPNLVAHLVNWYLKNKGKLGSPLPPWFMLFGILYDADGLVIVAHIPYVNTSSSSTSSTQSLAYLSCVVDYIPMVGLARRTPLSVQQSPVLNNVRAALALSTLQRHAYNMTTQWEGVAWPVSVVTSAGISNLHLRELFPDGASGSDGADHDRTGSSTDEGTDEEDEEEEEGLDMGAGVVDGDGDGDGIEVEVEVEVENSIEESEMISEDSDDDEERFKNCETDPAETEIEEDIDAKTEGVPEITHNKIITGLYNETGSVNSDLDMGIDGEDADGERIQRRGFSRHQKHQLWRDDEETRREIRTDISARFNQVCRSDNFDFDGKALNWH